MANDKTKIVTLSDERIEEIASDYRKRVYAVDSIIELREGCVRNYQRYLWDINKIEHLIENVLNDENVSQDIKDFLYNLFKNGIVE